MPPEILVAGHLCFDVIPRLDSIPGDPPRIFEPGRLVNLGPTTFTLGGVVANVGMALHRLGVETRLAAQVGDDLLGQTVIEHFRRLSQSFPAGIQVAAGASTSYTMVLNPPGHDRGFLHDPGTNAVFSPESVDLDRSPTCRLIHFGYPPLLQQCYEQPHTLIDLFTRARDRGMLVALDMSMPELDSPQAAVDWKAWMERVLPHVDLFLPSFDELLLMLDRPRFVEFQAAGGHLDRDGCTDAAIFERLAQSALAMGAGIVGLKLGGEGLFLRSGAAPGRFSLRERWRQIDFTTWCNRQLYAPCLEVEVAGTVGAGDTTIAGLLAAVLQGLPPEEAVSMATAVGACSVERVDAVSGIPTWKEVQARLASGWKRRRPQSPWTDFTERAGIWRGPLDDPLNSATPPSTASPPPANDEE